jgi:predicted ATP-binding protein involved in virulence
MTHQKNPLIIPNIILKNVGPFDDEGLTINFGEKKNSNKANVHIFVGKNGSGKSTVLKQIIDRLPYTIPKYIGPVIVCGDPQDNLKLGDLISDFGSNFITYFQNIDNNMERVDNYEYRIRDGEVPRISKEEYIALSTEIRMVELLQSVIEDIYDIKLRIAFENNNVIYYIKNSKQDSNETQIQFHQFSLGYKKLISLICDILIRVWQNSRGLEKREELKFILLLDEIDVHLHPEAQRKILPAIQKLFPNAEIFCTTHSPFVVNSVGDAWVYEISDENYLNEKGEIWKSGDSMRFLNPVSTSIFKSFDNVLGVQFNTDEEFGIGAREILKELSELIKLKNVTPRMTEIVNQIRKEGSESIKSRLEFELSKNLIVL